MSDASTPNPADMRHDYTRDALDESVLAADPFDQFEKWFRQAVDVGVIEPNAMSLATADREGGTSIRTVLMKGFDRSGFQFFTNLGSAKARQLAENPRVSLLFPWLALERQVIVNGTAHRLSGIDVARYFVTRPRNSQLAAWVSQQSSVISARQVLETKFEEIKRKFADGEVPVPPFWGGYRVRPRAIEFWQGRASRLHDRFRYSTDETGGWKIERLCP